MTASASLGWVVAVIVDRGGECRYPWIGASNCQGSGCQWVDGSPWSYAGPVSSTILSVITIIFVIIDTIIVIIIIVGIVTTVIIKISCT